MIYRGLLSCRANIKTYGPINAKTFHVTCWIEALTWKRNKNTSLKSFSSPKFLLEDITALQGIIIHDYQDFQRCLYSLRKNPVYVKKISLLYINAELLNIQEKTLTGKSQFWSKRKEVLCIYLFSSLHISFQKRAVFRWYVGSFFL